MCGINGKVVFGNNRPVGKEEIRLMNDRLRHRGPDGEGIYINPRGRAGLGHRRLAIIDLSPAGQQPMSNEDGSVWLVFNGEIYNFPELRPDLEKRGHKFKSKTDSEVIIHLYEDYGEDCLKYLRGMFAFAIWDEKQQKLFLARDRLGKKPLKYFVGPDFLIFASELKAILTNPAVKKEIDLPVLGNFFAYNFVAAPATGFKGIYKLPAGHYAVYQAGRLVVKRYWQLDFSEKLKISYQEAKEELQRRLTEAVKLRLVADVPLGAFLSGGVDSSAVVGLMSKFIAPVKTFSIGFLEQKFDERPFAKIIADYFATEHYQLEVKPDTIELLPKLVELYEEPYADSSALPTYYLAQLTRQYVKVALNGDGGDEAFGGYRRYRYWQLLHWLKKDIYQDIASYQYFHLGRHRRLFADDFWQAINQLSQLKLKTLDDVFAFSFRSFLPDDLLVKADISTMAHNLEARSPLLDQELLEFSAKLPASWKVRGWQNKIIFRDVLKDILPAATLTRGKYGFELPVDNWFRGPLYQWAREILLDAGARSQSYFNQKTLEKILRDHKQGRANHGQRIWLLLCFEFWLQSSQT